MNKVIDVVIVGAFIFVVDVIAAVVVVDAVDSFVSQEPPQTSAISG